MNTAIDQRLLWLRAALVGGIFFILGVGGHVTADGLLPARAVLVTLLGASVLAAAPLLRHRASGRRLFALLVGGQTLVHLVLSATAGHRGHQTGGEALPIPVPIPAAATADLRRTGSLYDVYQLGVPQVSDAGPSVPVVPLDRLAADVAANAPMMIVHVGVAGLVALWLACGERYLWTLIALVGRTLLRLTRCVAAVVVPAGAGDATLAVEPLVVPVGLWQSQPRSRRGPPRFAH